MKRAKSKKRKEEFGSEYEFMLANVWQIHNICEVCGKYISKPQPWCFAHILSKKMYPKERYNKNNVCLVCGPICHEQVDKMSSGIKYLIEQELKKGDKLTFTILKQLKQC